MNSVIDFSVRFVKYTYGGKGVFFYLLSLLALPLDGTAVWGALFVTSMTLYVLQFTLGTRLPSSWAVGDTIALAVDGMAREERKARYSFEIEEISEDRKTVVYSMTINGRKHLQKATAEHMVMNFDHYPRETIDA